MSEEQGVTIVAKRVGRHPCPLPGWRERRRRGIHPGDIIECDGCHQRWLWDRRGYDDSGKEWTRV